MMLCGDHVSRSPLYILLTQLPPCAHLYPPTPCTYTDLAALTYLSLSYAAFSLLHVLCSLCRSLYTRSLVRCACVLLCSAQEYRPFQHIRHRACNRATRTAVLQPERLRKSAHLTVMIDRPTIMIMIMMIMNNHMNK